MATSTSQERSTAAAAGQFAPTHWTVVLAAGGDTTHARVALEKLCQVYWPPIYAYIRRQGYPSHDAQDLTQGFFAQLLERNSLAGIDRARGKFRSFLLASLKHFLANEWDRSRAQKRGGGRTLISIDEKSADDASGLDLPDHLTADKIFERRWALTLLERTLQRLRSEYRENGKKDLFEKLKATLTGERHSIPYAEIAASIGTSEGNIKVAVHRLRQRYRELLRAEIADTVASQDEVEEELRNLFAALSV